MNLPLRNFFLKYKINSYHNLTLVLANYSTGGVRTVADRQLNRYVPTYICKLNNHGSKA